MNLSMSQHDPHKFAQFAAIVRKKLESLGVAALKDPEFMQDWLRMLQYAPEGFDKDQQEIFRMGLVPPPSGTDRHGQPVWELEELAEAFKVPADKLEAGLQEHARLRSEGRRLLH